MALSTTPILAIPNFNDTFIIEIDVSNKRVGVVLIQQGKPLAYMTKAIGPSKQAWPVYAKEMLAIFEAICTWRLYLLGKNFHIHTDQRSLKYFLEQQKWVSKLLGFEYDIIYKPGHDNSALDSLSRKPNSSILNVIPGPRIGLWDELKKEAQEHPYMLRLQHKLTLKALLVQVKD